VLVSLSTRLVLRIVVLALSDGTPTLAPGTISISAALATFGSTGSGSVHPAAHPASSPDSDTGSKRERLRVCTTQVDHAPRKETV